MVLKKAHGGISFYTSKWMEPYIEKNTLERQLQTVLRKTFLKS